MESKFIFMTWKTAIRNVSAYQMKFVEWYMMFGKEESSLMMSGCRYNNIILKRGNGSVFSMRRVKEKSMNICDCEFSSCGVESGEYGGAIHLFVSGFVKKSIC
jgi:hypothetical protein